MKTLFIDVRHSFSVSKESGKFNGGNNYSKKAIKILADNAGADTAITLICTAETIEYIKNEINNERLEYLDLNDLSELEATEHDIYYTPQCDDSLGYKKELIKFKKNNPNTRIFITVHDRRHLNNLYDKYDHLLKKGIQ